MEAVYVATYVRVSTVFEEQDTSLINQEEGLNDFIRRNAWILFDTYSERQSSFKKRVEFQRLVRDAMARKFQVILVKSLSRFGRSIGELNTVVPQLAERGVRFIALSEDIDTEKNGWQSKLAMYSMVYQMTSQTTSDWIRMAEKARAKRGEFTGSIPPYGYKKADKRLVPADDETPAVVQRIFDWYVGGEMGMQSIANLLSDWGIPTPGQVSGQKNASSYWHLSSVRTILTNPAYVGDLVAQREHVATLGSTRRRETSPEERVVLRDSHSPLISRDLFEAAQRLLNRRSIQHMPGKPNLFTHLLVCADCGKGMSCVRRDYGNTHYVCTTHLKRGAHLCGRHAIRETYLERVILNSLKRLTGEQVDTEGLIADIRRASEQQKKREKKRVESVKDRIAKLEKRKSTAEDKWLDGEWDKDRYHAALERFEAELLELRRELNGLEQASQTEQAVPRNIAQYARLERLDRQLALMLIKRIEVQEDGQVEINYNFTL